MGRVFKGNGRWVRSLVGIVEEQSRDLAATMAVYTNTSSPASYGAQGFGNQGLPGSGVNAFEHETSPVQSFTGVDVRSINGAGVNRATGDLSANYLPSANGGALAVSNPLAWMSLQNTVGVGFGG
jgi:hypothetical protein